MTRIVSVMIFVFVLALLIIQDGNAMLTADSTRPSVTAQRVKSQIHVDGQLDEPEWQGPGVSEFTQRDPVEGAAPTQRTEVWVAYDDAAIYIAAKMYDSPDSIMSAVGRHDAYLDCDWFTLSLDSYHDRRTGFYFMVNPTGSVRDGTLYNDSWDDNTWDGVWSASAAKDDKGWTAEMRIPYSQLRFANQDIYTWGINFQRTIQRKNEEDFYVMVPKKESGFVSRFADLNGISSINPPRKLEVLPYVSSSGKFTDHEIGDPFNKGHTFSQNAGADIKMGLGSNLTLNATLNPDFGQVEVDPAVVNLTQFETSYDEKRPFFIEGSNFLDFGYGGANNNYGFNFGNPSFFYSRRIGGSPRGGITHNGFLDYPDKTHIIGAAKLTGKVAEGWSMGTVQAVTAREFATVDSMGARFDEEVEPLTYYGVARMQGEFDQGRSAIGFIGTATVRDLSSPGVADQFNRRGVTFGTDGWFHLDTAKVWVVTGWVAGTRVEGTNARMIRVQRGSLHYYQRPDISYGSVDSGATSLTGTAGRFALNKESGSLIVNAAYGFVSPGFESNDLGFTFRTNVKNAHLVLGYRNYDNDGWFRRKRIELATFRSWDYDGRIVGHGYFMFYNFQLQNFWNVNGNFSMNPGRYDGNLSRGGPIMKTTTGYNMNYNLWSDSRKSLNYGTYVGAGRSESGAWWENVNPEVTWKATPSFRMTITPNYYREVQVAYYLGAVADPLALKTYGVRYVFGKLEQREISAGMRFDWTFSPRLSLQTYIQPLISVGQVSEYKILDHPGEFAFNRPAEGHDSNGDLLLYPDGENGPAAPISPVNNYFNGDFNDKFLRLNAVLRWEYQPGSALYVVWTHNKANFDHAGEYGFGENFDNLITSRGDNVFQIKLSYWWNP